MGRWAELREFPAALERLARSGIVRQLTHRRRYDDLPRIARLIEADLARHE